MCQPVGTGASLEQMGLVMRFPKVSLQGDRMGLQSAFNNLRPWSQMRFEFFEIDSCRRRPRNSRPARGFLANGKSHSRSCRPRSFIRSQARLNSIGMGKSRDANSSVPPKLNDVCYSLWLRKACDSQNKWRLSFPHPIFSAGRNHLDLAKSRFLE